MSAEAMSLADAFAPPDESRYGVFGVACALTADKHLVDLALERFARQPAPARERDARLALVLLTDPHEPPLERVAGVYQPRPEDEDRWPQRISQMHAKVALLAFGPARWGSPDHIRLVVSTGNLTMYSANRCIDLVWVCDLPAAGSRANAQGAADVLAAASFFQRLVGTEDTPGWYSLARQPAKRVAAHLDWCRSTAEGMLPRIGRPLPRFINTVDELKPSRRFKSSFFADLSIGRQVIDRFVDDSYPRHRNFIVCASGFFEGVSGDGHECPRVLTQLLDSLKGTGALARSLGDDQCWLLANPETAGAVGPWIANTAPEDLGWVVCRAKHPHLQKEEAFVHAKYVLVGNFRKDRVTSGQVYLGSGNLSHRGFAAAPLPAGADTSHAGPGNVEAGVVVSVEDVDYVELCGRLGIDAVEYGDRSAFKHCDKGEEQDGRDLPLQHPPPLLGLVWEASTGELALDWRKRAPDAACTLRWSREVVTAIPGMAAIRLAEGAAVPMSVEVEQAGERWQVPVFTTAGTFCPPPLQRRQFDDLLGMLQSFPRQTWDGDDDGGETDGGDAGPAPPDDIGQADRPRPQLPDAALDDLAARRQRYPLHRAMLLVETLAEANQSVTAQLMPDWVLHLRHLLLEEIEPAAVAELGSLGCNFLAPLLKETGFAPPVDDESYRTLLAEVMKAWGLADSPSLLPEEVLP